MDGKVQGRILNRKTSVLFVGSFINKSKNGHVGGQMFACNSLIKSSLSERINWILLDTTASTNEKRSFLERTWGAVKRLFRFIYFIIFQRPSSVLIFTSHGFGFREKGLMIRIAKAFGLKTILAPRSGILKNDIQNSLRFRGIVRKVFNKCDYIICQGISWKTYFVNEFNMEDEKLINIPNWISKKRTISTPKTQSDVIRVLFLGWIETNKGIHEIIKAANILRNENILWILGGKGRDFEKVVKEVDQLGLTEKVHLKGWLIGDKKDKAFADADIFILPSYREGMPNSLLEAMQNKMAVVASSVGGIPDVIKDGINGLLINPGKVEELVNSVLLLASDGKLREKFGKKAEETIQSNHSIENAILKFSKILET